jgi:hypothetical protein
MKLGRAVLSPLLLAGLFIGTLVIPAAPAFSQKESRLHSEFRLEGEALQLCGQFSFYNLTECMETIVTGQPMHITVGSLAPDDGIAAGLAFVAHKDYTNEWRANWDVDGQATQNGSWRAGAYMKAYRLPSGLQYRVAPLFNFYSQSVSLTRVDYFGLGPNSLLLNHTTYGFSENITGADAAIPLQVGAGGPKIAIVAEVNGRFPSVRAGSDASLPSIGTLFSEATAPGLTHQPRYLELSEGVRIYPAFFKDRIRLNYLVQFQQFAAAGEGTYSFRRWNGDFSHEIPLYSWLPKSLSKDYFPNRAGQFSYNGPDDCTGSNASNNVSLTRAATTKPNPAVPCPIVSTTQKLEGSITLRAFLSESFADRGSVVPFYFSPTIGGSNINGTPMLASYPDYRFRGPDLLLFQEQIEHSLGKLPLGIFFGADEGKIGLRRDDVSLDHLRHTLSAGLTVHAGGLPLIYFSYAWGGGEGTHTTATVSPTLLGGSSRPSLF